MQTLRTDEITYYAVARNPKGQLEQLFVRRANGRQVSQQWTGITYKSMRAADNDLRQLNS